MDDGEKKFLSILILGTVGIFAIVFWEQFLGLMMIIGFICFLIGWLSIFKR